MISYLRDLFHLATHLSWWQKTAAAVVFSLFVGLGAGARTALAPPPPGGHRGYSTNYPAPGKGRP